MQPILTGVVESLTIGGQVFLNLTGLIILVGDSGGTATTQKTTFRKPGASSGYQVTAGKTLTIKAIRYMAQQASLGFVLLYSDNDVGMAGNTAYTNAVYNGGTNTAGNYLVSATVGNISEIAPYFSIPATKFPGISPLGNTLAMTCQAYGYEA